MAREMYPEKFRNMISPEHFDKAQEEVQRQAGSTLQSSLWGNRIVTVDDRPVVVDAPHLTENEVAATLSPISRLFAAVKDVLKQVKEIEGQYADDRDIVDDTELRAAYEALGLTDE